MLETWVAPTAGRDRGELGAVQQRVQYALESQTLAAELQMENSLGRSLNFGRVAGSLIVLCRLGRVTRTGGPRRADCGRRAAIAGRTPVGSNGHRVTSNRKPRNQSAVP